MFLVDANVLLDVFANDPKWRPGRRVPFRDALLVGPVGVNPIIYAETSLAFADVETLDGHLEALMLDRLQLPYEAAFSVASAYRGCRRAGGTRSAPLPDFYIGAHAEADGLALLIGDAGGSRPDSRQ